MPQPTFLKISIFFLLSVPLNARYSERINRPRRQVSLDDLVHTALQIVKPIFDTSQPLLDTSGKKVTENERISSSSLRESNILGMKHYSSLDHVPICRGNSKICQFISCTAHNFKHDENFANLNLAAQVIGDQQLRKTIGGNPDAIIAVCHEQGLSVSQCQLFARGFQLIDRFMTTIEKPAIGNLANTESDIFAVPPIPASSATQFMPKNKPKNITTYIQNNKEKVPDFLAPLSDPGNSEVFYPTALPEPIKPINDLRTTSKPSKITTQVMQVPLRPIVDTLNMSNSNNGQIFGSRTWSTRHLSNNLNTATNRNSSPITLPKNSPLIVISTSEQILNYNSEKKSIKNGKNLTTTTTARPGRQNASAKQVATKRTTKNKTNTTTTTSTVLIKKRPATQPPRATLPPKKDVITSQQGVSAQTKVEQQKFVVPEQKITSQTKVMPQIFTIENVTKMDQQVNTPLEQGHSLPPQPIEAPKIMEQPWVVLPQMLQRAETVMPQIRRPYTTSNSTQKVATTSNNNNNSEEIAQLDELLVKTISQIPEAEEEDPENSRKLSKENQELSFNQDEFPTREKRNDFGEESSSEETDKLREKRGADDYYDELSKKAEDDNSVIGSENSQRSSLNRGKSIVRINCMQYLG